MKFRSAIIALGATTAGVNAAYPGDIVQYWALQGNLLSNGTIVGGLQSVPSAWAAAVVHAAIYLAAEEVKDRPLAFQQLSVSHAAHKALTWVYHGTRNYGAIDAALRQVLEPIGIAAESSDGSNAKHAGRRAARTVILARSDDGINDFVNYVVKKPAPGVYQPTPGGNPLPDNPQAPYIRLFGGIGDVYQFKVAPPPNPGAPEYEKYINRVKEVGARNSTVRTATETETAYYWREPSVTQWTRFANAVVSDSLKENVVKSAKVYAQFYYAFANAGIASFYIKYRDNAWRPVTAIRYPEKFLASGRTVYDPNWTPLLTTPSHPDYTSTHATFGGAAVHVLTQINRSEKVNITISTNVTVDNIGVITRRYTNLTYATFENGESRVFGGIHFDFAREAGDKLGREVAKKTLSEFDNHWRSF
ncbi:acid phosphatase/Vanadium-dependent haloperoxidase [Sporormia fimetaria CBS 119925]|uniref:Acid phosphatase/Vanadium-dependent haloperoxidase n=1 Tax=Sporormia fimetaria CBS 119925 TaxID=1340428 RepID=A0A6A6V505_9PLEO|nr:acid phosphatase/Vanadium-dependent haloperoxidase [Sporormia fimetaria CBS 119925]